MSESAPVSRSAQRNLDLMRHRDETLARWPADDPAVAAWLDQFRDDEAGEESVLDSLDRCRIMPYLKEGILRGRELASEPADVDY